MPFSAHRRAAGIARSAATGVGRLPAKLDGYGNAAGRISHISAHDESKP